jgi:hypothetical protein
MFFIFFQVSQNPFSCGDSRRESRHESSHVGHRLNPYTTYGDPIALSNITKTGHHLEVAKAAAKEFSTVVMGRRKRKIDRPWSIQDGPSGTIRFVLLPNRSQLASVDEVTPSSSQE